MERNSKRQRYRYSPHGFASDSFYNLSWRELTCWYGKRNCADNSGRPSIYTNVEYGSQTQGSDARANDTSKHYEKGTGVMKVSLSAEEEDKGVSEQIT